MPPQTGSENSNFEQLTPKPGNSALAWTAGAAAEANSPDRASNTSDGKSLQLTYGDPSFDQKLAAGGFETLRLSGLPAGAGVSTWVDDKGVFFWVKGGTDNRAHHYLPAGLKTVEINGQRQSVDEMRINAIQSYLKENDANKRGISSINGGLGAFQFAENMSGISDDALKLSADALRKSAANSENPYQHIWLGSIMTALSMKPIIEQVKQGKDNISLQDPATMQGLTEARKEFELAERYAIKHGQLVMPNYEMQMPLSPYALNPYAFNPDLYWGGALYQATSAKAFVDMYMGVARQVRQLELPRPSLPPPPRR